LKEAARHYSAALEIEPDHAQRHYNLNNVIEKAAAGTHGLVCWVFWVFFFP
jgi:hypothetical protein